MTFVNRVDTLLGPEDVALVPGGGIAVVRCVVRPIDPVFSHPDEIIVIKTGGTSPGERAIVAANPPHAGFHGLTASLGASDLVAVTSARAVLIGQNHEGPESSWRTFIDVLDLTDTYGSGPIFAKSFEFANSGGANDVAITPDGTWAVVNSRNRIDVIDLDPNPQSGQPVNPSLVLTVNTGPSDPSYLRDTVVMTRDSAGPMKAVVMTRKIVGSINRTVLYVLSFSTPGTPPSVSGPLELNPSAPGLDHPPHDIALTPDGRLAVVTARGAVGLLDVGAGTLLTHAVTGTLREYEDMADSVEVSATQAVVIAKTAPVQPSVTEGWRIDVYDIAPGPNGLTPRTHFTSAAGSHPHDLALGPAGDLAAVRTMQHIVLLGGIDQTGGPVSKTEIASVSEPLQRFFNNNDSIVMTPSWLSEGLAGGGGPPGGIVQFVVALARGGSAGQPAARIDVVNVKDLTPSVDHSQLVFDAAFPQGVTPGSVQLARAGRAVLVHSRAYPDAQTQAPSGYDEATGEDLIYLRLVETAWPFDQYEAWGHPEANSDSFAVERQTAVVISNLFPGNAGFVQTMIVN